MVVDLAVVAVGDFVVSLEGVDVGVDLEGVGVDAVVIATSCLTASSFTQDALENQLILHLRLNYHRLGCSG